MTVASAFSADRFLSALSHRLSRVTDRRANSAVGCKKWTSLMFEELQKTANDCAMVSCSPKNRRGPFWAKKEHLLDVTWFRQDCGDWDTPELILEHENQYKEVEFLKDFWKLLVGYAPVRVMIGYCGKKDSRVALIESVNQKLRDSKTHIRFPGEVEDLILLGYLGMNVTDFTVYRRRDFEFQKSADSLDAVIPDPDEDMSAWDAYLHRTQVAMTDRLHAETARLRNLGIIDEQGNLLRKTLPPDMAPNARTSIITG